MKWITETAPSIGAERICCDFLWLPMKIGGITRWLEFAYWKEVYLQESPEYGPFWIAQEWADMDGYVDI